MKQPADGQWLTHDRYGVGVALRSTDTKTTIQFDNHGPITFVTEMLQAVLIPPPDRPPAAARRRKKAAAPPAA